MSGTRRFLLNLKILDYNFVLYHHKKRYFLPNIVFYDFFLFKKCYNINSSARRRESVYETIH